MSGAAGIGPGCHVVARGGVLDQDGICVAAADEVFTFRYGCGEAIIGMEQAMAGRKAGDRLQFVCAPEDAYGPYRPELVFDAVRANLPPDAELAAGNVLTVGGSNGRFQLRVIEAMETGARLDGNHPLAGKTLHFDLEVLEVTEP